MRRISWIDQRISLGSLAACALFFERFGIGVMANGRHHGKGQHDQRDMAVPPVPGAGLVVIKAKFVLCGLETVLDRPSMSFDAHQCFHACALRTPGGEVSQLAIWDIAADQQATCPDPVEMGIEVISVEIGQIKVSPVVEALALCARACRKALLKTVRIVDETVEDGICQSGIADGLMPMVDGELAHDDGGTPSVAVLEDLQQIAAL